MKAKLLNLGLIITSLMGYLQWGKGNSSFLFEAELEVIQKLFTNPQSAVHPFTLLPLLGQILLLFTLFQKQVSKTLTIIGLSCLSLLLVLMFVIGLMTLNWKIIASTIPFISISILTIRHLRTKLTNK